MTTATETAVRIRPRTFAALGNRNLRLLLTGLLITSIGTWVQRIAQDWLVLTLTRSPTAVGVTTMCQLLPMLLFSLHAGVIADRYPRRTILMVTQSSMAALSALLAFLVLSDRIQVWQVDALAFALGTAMAIDNPARQALVSELSDPAHLRNAVSMVSSVFQLGAMLGPALGGVLLVTIGSGYCFALNAASYLAVILAVTLIRQPNRTSTPPAQNRSAGISQTLRYVRRRGDLAWPIVLIACYGLFTFSLPVTLAAYAKSVFDIGPSGYAALNSVVALGSVTGALVSARRARPTRLRTIAAIGALLAGAEIAAGAAPTEWMFLPLIALLGATTLYFVTSAQTMIQLGTDPRLRGRVLGVYLLAFLGSGSLGGPLVGYLDSHYGPNAGLLIAGAASALATLVVAARIAHTQHLRPGLRAARHGGFLIPAIVG